MLEGMKSEVVREVVEGGKTRFMPDGSVFVFSDKTEKTSQGMHQGVL